VQEQARRRSPSYPQRHGFITGDQDKSVTSDPPEHPSAQSGVGEVGDKFTPSCQQSTSGGEPRRWVPGPKLLRSVVATQGQADVLTEINDLLDEALEAFDAAAPADAVRLERLASKNITSCSVKATGSMLGRLRLA
jgi:hypothetical protein